MKLLCAASIHLVLHKLKKPEIATDRNYSLEAKDRREKKRRKEEKKGSEKKSASAKKGKKGSGKAKEKKSTAERPNYNGNYDVFINKKH